MIWLITEGSTRWRYGSQARILPCAWSSVAATGKCRCLGHNGIACGRAAGGAMIVSQQGSTRIVGRDTAAYLIGRSYAPMHQRR
ncbi:hypothetical protein BS78_05G040200 [Paspalum vaginatum]|nr:hypothetical protein BS78_05G040200 [Paspalum vaginatum]